VSTAAQKSASEPATILADGEAVASPFTGQARLAPPARQRTPATCTAPLSCLRIDSVIVFEIAIVSVLPPSEVTPFQTFQANDVKEWQERNSSFKALPLEPKGMRCGSYSMSTKFGE
jgi:hypothetical protein